MRSLNDYPLLATKITLPPLRPGLVPRPRLLARLDELTQRKVALISAPAGCGKTTLLTEWARAAGVPVATLSVDRDDSDVTRFLSYVVAAWERVEPGVRDSPLGLLAGSLNPPPERVLSSLLNEGAARQRHFVLALDDCHLIEDPAIHDALAFIVDHLPPQMHLLLAGRADPPLPLPKLRARDELVELRADDLRFTGAEIARFFAQTAGTDLSATDCAILADRTEGWVAGLQLAALSPRASGDPLHHVEAVSGKDRHIADYLAEEVLGRQPEHLKAFLLQTAIAERLCAPLCRAITGRADSQSLLEYLEQANLFLVPLDNERRWYRYHQLFVEFLRHELGRRTGDLAILHRRASQWYADNSFHDEAVRHAIAGGHLDLAAKIIEGNIVLKIGYGQHKVVADWLKSLPGEYFARRPLLGLYRALFLLLGGQIGDCIKCLEEVERVVGQNLSASEGTAESRANEARIAGTRAILACFQNDLESAISFANRAFQGLPDDDDFYRFAVRIALGDTYRRGSQWAEAIQPYGEALKIARRAPVPFIAIHPLSALGDLYEMRGQLRRAYEFRREALDLISLPANRCGIPAPLMGWAHIRMGELLYEWNNLEDAARHVARGIELAELGGDVHALVFGHLALGQIRLAEGDIGEATDQMLRAKPLVEAGEVQEWMNALDQLQVQLWLAEGDVSTALHWAEERRFSVDDEASYRYEIARTALARVLIAQGEHDADVGALDRAQVLLNRLLWASEAAGRTGVVVQVLALKALTHRLQGDAKRAMSDVERALRLAEPQGYVRLVVNLGSPMASLLKEARSRGLFSEYIGRLLSAFEPNAPASGDRQGSSPDALSKREIEVLQLLAAGSSNRQIADRLVIAVGTVKRHVATIYEKLGVNSRTRAVARSRELGILS